MKRWMSLLLAILMLSTTLVCAAGALPVGGGEESDIPLDGQKTGIKSITFQPITIDENTEGVLTGPAGEQYYHYNWTKLLKGEVKFTDGHTLTFTGTSFRYDGRSYTLLYTDGQSTSPWIAGRAYTVNLTVEGVKADVSVRIVGDALPGDMDNDGFVTDQDAIYLLWHTLFPEQNPITQDGDVNSDGTVNDTDAIYLLWHSLFPENTPLYPGK